MTHSGLERALEAMTYMERGRPYSLHPEDRKCKLLDELERVSRGLGIAPLVIGGLAVSHHGYVSTTVDVGVLVSREDGATLVRRLKGALGWKRFGEGFKNTVLDVGLDIRVEGQRTSPRGEEVFPSPADLRRLAVRPLPVVALPDLIALKAMSARAQDDADAINLLKRHRSRMDALSKAARRRLRTDGAREHLAGLVARAKEELKR